ncbi:glucose-1-phosphate adenylyltransferase large subunit 1-like [Impatiens glandulifera]|uniref:glucose-1-phosphate adenylyltransferase large subunit 1-like n=1 Tax=Impatiens glandulifera TaxID=253017 RepID=UPI001FB071EA|nr:glucose-1-phosphate adenylyltransferase large subunit 1-like [Impatiens glandulifera]
MYFNTHLATVSNLENGFWGQRNWCQLGKGLRSGKWVRKIEYGISCSAVTSENGRNILTVQTPPLERQRVNPKNVAAIILGGGQGTQLFPLTLKAATPAVPVGGCYKLIDIPMSNCINNGINKIFILTQFNSASLNRHIARTYFGNGVSFGDGFVEVLAATQTAGETGLKWFQGTADAVRQFSWVFEDAKNKNVEHILILSGDHLYRMNYMDFIQNHIDRNADITVSCVPVGEDRASDYGLMKCDSNGRVVQFTEKPKGDDLKAMKVDTSTLHGLSPEEAAEAPYIASMGVYVFKADVLLNLLKLRYPTFHDFGSEIIPSAVDEQNVHAYVFRDYWEDIGTIKSFYEANLALTKEFPSFQFYDPTTPIFTSPRFLPPTKIDKCKIKDSIISHGCFLRESCSIQHSIVGERSRIDFGVELKDSLMMGADHYQTESEIASLLAEGKIPMGIGSNTKISKCIIDKNAKIGKNVIIKNKDGVEEADRPEEGFYIRSGITIILEKATIKDGMVF